MGNELGFKIAEAKYLLNLALPYMQTIIALDGMEAWMREHWIKQCCAYLEIEDNGRRHPLLMSQKDK